MAKKKELLRHRFTYDGKRYSVYGYTKAELIEKAAEKRKQLETQQAITRNLTVNQWKEEWLTTYKEGTVSDKTYSDYRTVLKHLNLSMPVRSVRPVHLQKELNKLTGMSNSLIRKFMVLSRRLFEDAVDNGLCITNPAKKLSAPKGYTRARRPLTLSERRLIEEVAPTSEAGPFVALMLYAGCRPAEAGAVQGKDVDLRSMRLHIRGTKTDNADRFVPISDHLLPYVQHLKRDQYAVMDSRGNPTTRDSRRNLWLRFRRELNIAAGCKMGRPTKHSPHDLPIEDLLADDLTPYILRHTFCTDLEAAGVPINVARDFMGHGSIEITSRIYTHRSDAALDDAAQKMSAYAPLSNVRKLDRKNNTRAKAWASNG